MAVATLQPPAPSTVASQPTDRHAVLPGQTPQGQFILSVLVKRTYDIVPGGRCTRAETDQKVIPGDVYYGDPMSSTVCSSVEPSGPRPAPIACVSTV